MGVSVREKVKGSGEWWLFINHQGHRRSKKIGTKAAANRAKKEVEEALAKRKLGIIEDKNETFGYYCDKWLTRYAPSDCKPSTLNDYRALVKNHLEGRTKDTRWECWDMPVRQITVGMIEDFLADKRSVRSASTVKHIKCCISLSLQRAVKENAIAANPCAEAKIVGSRKDSKRKKNDKVKVYTEAQVELLLDTFKQHRPQYWLLILFMVRTGCRCSEVAELRWSDLDLDNRVARIERGLVRGRIEKTTKSGVGRDVDLTPQLVKELKKAKLASSGDGLVFPNTAGNHLDLNLIRRRHFNKMIALAKLPPRVLHDLRHTYASILLKKCRDVLYVQKQLGHSKPSITLDVYSHFLEEDSPTRMVDMLDSAPNRTLYAPETKKEPANVG